MKTPALKTSIYCCLAVTLFALILGGCARKHIPSTPPARHKPAQAPESEPAPKPKVVEDKPLVIEETYVVDAPDENGEPAVRVEEDELAEEPLPDPVEVEATPAETASTAEDAPTVAEESAPAQTEAVEATPMAEMYFVQVGAFSKLENANAVLAQLIANGYKGSKFVKTGSGLYRVQAGAFAEKADAETAQEALMDEFPNSFILKETPIQ